MSRALGWEAVRQKQEKAQGAGRAVAGGESREEVRARGAGHALAGGESRQEEHTSDMHDVGITGEAQ